MFSGIIEAQANVIKTENINKAIRILVSRPESFTDLKLGDSICVNGVCLTIENFDQNSIQFCVGVETLNILGPAFQNWLKYNLNLERSLKFGDRVHGHLVTGHVDQIGTIQQSYADGDCWQIQIQVSASHKMYFWSKGSVCLNGVSLTVNAVEENSISVCLIPETIHATNLKFFEVGDKITLESDYLAKAYFNLKEMKI